jgi:indole-3-glycerol phosphate synthase
MILDDILKSKREEVRLLREKLKLPVKQSRLPKLRDFKKAISRSAISLIAEVKAASPSAGVIIKEYSPDALARAYEKAGASAISVLTDQSYFKGSIDDLIKVRKAVRLPILRKDFIIDEAQIYESRLAGADAVLLIVRILEQEQLENFIKLINDLDMTALVEAHSIKEAKAALDAGSEVIGINNRDLNTLKIDLSTTVNIINELPQLMKKVIVAESGITEKSQVELFSSIGIKAVLVGEALLKSPDAGAKIKELIG